MEAVRLERMLDGATYGLCTILAEITVDLTGLGYPRK